MADAPPRARRLAVLLAGAPLLLAPAPGAAQLEASVVAADVTPPVGVPLAGYGGGKRRRWFPDVFGLHPYCFYFEPSDGVLDPIRAKVLLLRDGPAKLAFVSLDLVGAPRALRAAILDAIAPLGFGPNEVFVSGTHTHSGPGTLTEIGFWEIVATDRFESAIHDPLVAGVAGVVQQALAALEPAELLAASFEAQDLQSNRRDVPGHFDATANLLLVRAAAGANWLGALVNLPIHGTALGAGNLEYSADVLGAIEHEFGAALGAQNGGAQAPVPVVFVNGAEGDVAPKAHGVADMAQLASQFTSQALAALSGARALQPGWTVRGPREVQLGSPFLHFKPCAEGWLGSLLPSWLGLPTGFWLPSDATIWSIELDDMLLFTWPGEPTTWLGLALQDLGAQKGAVQTWVLGLTNDHLGYFTTPEEFDEGGYEACVSLYGPQAGHKLVEEHELLLQSP